MAKESACTGREATVLPLAGRTAKESAHEERFSKGDRVYFSLHPRDFVVVREEEWSSAIRLFTSGLGQSLPSTHVRRA